MGKGHATRMGTLEVGLAGPEEAIPVEIYARATANSGVTQDEIGLEVEPVGAIPYHMVDAAIVVP